MHANSLQILLLMVAQVTPGSAGPNEDNVPPTLLAPPIKSLPVDLEAPPARKVDSPTPEPPSDDAGLAPTEFTPSEFVPSEFTPAKSEDSPAPAVGQMPPTNEFRGSPLPAANPPSQSKGDVPGGTFPLRSAPVQAAPREASPAAASSVLERTSPPNLRASQPDSESSTRHPSPSSVDAKTLLQRALEQPGEQSTVGVRPTRLRQALERSTVRSEQIAVVKSYWRLTVAEADFNHAQDELSLLSSFPAATTPHGKKQLTAALHSAHARSAEAQLALLFAQHELAATSPATTDSLLPQSADAPLVGPYKTQFDQMFSGRTAPAEIRRLAQSLPLYHDLLEARAGSVAAAEQALIELADAYPEDFSYGEIIDAFLRLRDQRIAFLVSVRDYNNAIADYSLNTIGSGLSLDAIVATLIETPAAPSVLISSGSVRPASAQQPIRTAGQPTPARRLVPVTQAKDGFVPRRVSPAAPSQLTPAVPAQALQPSLDDSAPSSGGDQAPTPPDENSAKNSGEITPGIPLPTPNEFDFQP